MKTELIRTDRSFWLKWLLVSGIGLILGILLSLITSDFNVIGGLIGITVGLNLYLTRGKKITNHSVWVTISALGFAVGFGVSVILNFVIVLVFVEIFTVAEQNRILLALIEGALIGGSTAPILWFTLRGDLVQSNRSALPVAVYSFVGMSWGLIFSLVSSLISSNVYDLMYAGEDPIAMGTAIGMTLALIQWLFIRRKASLPGWEGFWWILLNSALWASFSSLSSFASIHNIHLIPYFTSSKGLTSFTFKLMTSFSVIGILIGKSNWIFLRHRIRHPGRVIWITGLAGLLLGLLLGQIGEFLYNLAAAF
jgi:hypothetical protein